MNVGEAMETAAAYLAHKQEEDPIFTSEEVAITLAAEVERLRAEVQRLDIAGMHSCHESCPKLPCVQRREIERLKRDLHAAKFGRTSRTQKNKTPPEA